MSLRDDLWIKALGSMCSPQRPCVERPQWISCKVHMSDRGIKERLRHGPMESTLWLGYCVLWGM